MSEEILKLADLSKVKVGDTIWVNRYGKDTVSKIVITDHYQIKTTKGQSYTFDGKLEYADEYPSAFIRNPFENINTFQEREMMVSNDNINWYKRNVFYKRNNLFLADSLIDQGSRLGLVSGSGPRYRVCWKYAKEIEPKLKLTFEEIAKKFNTDVKNIEIIK